MAKAGGVAGLLMLVEHGSASTTTNHFTAYDGNGNVVSLIKADATSSARYEYGPFGQLVRQTGPLAKPNPFRFSTKFWDEESGLVYYGYRYYSALLGRWISRDPSEEKGGVNLFGFCRNAPTLGCDRDGKDYYVVIVEGSSGVNHRQVIGDDSSGDSYMFEMLPDVGPWWQFYRRFSGSGIINSDSRIGPALDYVTAPGILGVEKIVQTTLDQDERLSEAAQRLDSTGFWYFLGVQDCRSAEDRLNNGVHNTSMVGRFFERITTAILGAVDDAFSVFDTM
jgi:RHS repeat-associated protein